jgi:predicted Zn-dependent protease
LTQLADASGLRFRIITSTAADVTIAWTPTLIADGQVQPDEAGLTRLSIRSGPLGSTPAAAAIQISTHLAAGDGHNGEVPVLLHELGHAVGMAHYVGPDVMNPVDQGYPNYQTGDIAGLADLYRPDTCG